MVLEMFALLRPDTLRRPKSAMRKSSGSEKRMQALANGAVRNARTTQPNRPPIVDAVSE